MTQPTVGELARELGHDPKSLRAWMRSQNWRSSVELGQPWVLTDAQVASLRIQFGDADDPSVVANVNAGDPHPDLSVAELLDSYRRVLASLRARGLVRTNNAPIGDLAEYCAAVVYDGVLAPNSEKSYDLVAADGRTIQVKVRQTRAGVSSSAVFSPIRSFGFDAALFLLVDDDLGQVTHARELSAEDVQVIGRHRTHTNGTVLRIGQLKSLTLGSDRTADFRSAWAELLDSRP